MTSVLVNCKNYTVPVIEISKFSQMIFMRHPAGDFNRSVSSARVQIKAFELAGCRHDEIFAFAETSGN